ncbi:heparin lyase I family protein [Aureimonas sp. SK2]|uniref:heparin lyase I family protein n=1 Tax=Aureimonas sp. SK2 TaxID=3015992 RepID=UPI002443D1A2|nr:heparin lyase I family protein [Aureimonas sp. SK2]
MLVPRPKVTNVGGIINAVVQCHAAGRYNPNVVINGKTYALFEAQEGDIAVAGDEGDFQYRSELRVNDPLDDVGSQDLTYWGWTGLIPADFPDLVDPVTGKKIKVTIGQWLNGDFDPLCIVYYGGKAYLRINAHGPDDKDIEIAGVVKGTPFHLDFAIKFVAGDKASAVTVWKEGVKIIDIPAVTLFVKKYTSVYFKIGCYLNSTPALDDAGYPPLRFYVADLYVGLANKPNTTPVVVGTPTVPVPEPTNGVYAIVASIRKQLSQLESTVKDGYGAETSKYLTSNVKYLDLMVTKMRKADAKG